MIAKQRICIIYQNSQLSEGGGCHICAWITFRFRPCSIIKTEDITKIIASPTKQMATDVHGEGAVDSL